MDKSVTATELKARCSEVVDRVAKKRETVVITRHGRPVAKLVPIDEKRDSLFGFARGCVKVSGNLIEPLDVAWEAAE